MWQPSLRSNSSWSHRSNSTERQCPESLVLRREAGCDGERRGRRSPCVEATKMVHEKDALLDGGSNSKKFAAGERRTKQAMLGDHQY